MGKNVTIRFVDLDKEVYINSSDLFKWLTLIADNRLKITEANVIRAVRNDLDRETPNATKPRR